MASASAPPMSPVGLQAPKLQSSGQAVPSDGLHPTLGTSTRTTPESKSNLVNKSAVAEDHATSQFPTSSSASAAAEHPLKVNTSDAVRFKNSSEATYSAGPIFSAGTDSNSSNSPVSASTTCSVDTDASSVDGDSDSYDESLALVKAQPQSGPASDPVPRQTLLKALASVARDNKPEALPLGGTMTSIENRQRPVSTSACNSQKLANVLSELVQPLSMETPTTAMPVLKSPCFYHQRFDDAVNIDKVLDEIKNDDTMSHSRLVQTATGVREVSKQLQRRPIKRAVRNVMIVTKARDNQLVHMTNDLASWLLSTPRYGSDVGVNVYVDAKLRNSKRFDAAGIKARNPRFEHMLKYWTPNLCWTQPEMFDLVLTLGGDGTVLFTSWLFQRVVPPVLSFSLGSLGFMTTFEYEKYKSHLNRVMGDAGMKINLRMRFTCTVWRAGDVEGEVREGEQFEVLNELVIDRGPSPYVSNLELYGDDELLTVVQADGCIFSTPTGSTAYSLSAGGSLVHPDIPAILLTPICPHTLSFRPMVLSDTMALRVAIPRSSRATAYCAFDGKGRVELRQGDCVTIAASQYPYPTVTRTDTEWFDSVSRTLRWNVRAAPQKPFDSVEGTGGEDDGWDIDTDSGFYDNEEEEGSTIASPVRRKMLEM